MLSCPSVWPTLCSVIQWPNPSCLGQGESSWVWRTWVSDTVWSSGPWENHLISPMSFLAGMCCVICFHNTRPETCMWDNPPTHLKQEISLGLAFLGLALRVATRRRSASRSRFSSSCGSWDSSVKASTRINCCVVRCDSRFFYQLATASRIGLEFVHASQD